MKFRLLEDVTLFNHAKSDVGIPRLRRMAGAMNGEVKEGDFIA